MYISTIINNIYNFITDKSIIITIIIVILLYLFIFFILGNSPNKNSSSDNFNIFDNLNIFGSNNNNNTSDSTPSINNNNEQYYMESSGSISSYFILFIFIVFIILVIWYFVPFSLLNYLNYKYFAGIFNIFTNNPTVAIDVETPNEKKSLSPILSTPSQDQVFNIPGNYYKYNDAKSLCNAYGSRLANYSEIEDAYNNGAEWCNYGWSNDQMALFPTQAETYKNLQTIPGHEHDCGRPGINGGYISNPNVKFGVNCYGKKPKMNEIEQELMETSTPYPLTQDDIKMQYKTDMLRKKLPNILVSPFNYNNWDKI
jgi:hypothetical protein